MNKVNVIIANYNYGDFVIPCIESVLNQTYDKIEIYFIDDGSSDRSWETLKDYLNPNEISTYFGNDTPYDYMSVTNRFKINAYKTENRGASLARNFLIERSINSGHYTAILDADDEMFPNKIETLVNKLDEYEELGVAYADYIIKRDGYNLYESKESYSVRGLYRSCIVHSGSLIKNNYLKSIKLDNGEYYKSSLHGPASKGFIGCTEDYDLWFRLSKVCMFVHVPSCLTVVNEHGRNQSMRMTPEIFQDNIRRMSL